MTFKDILDITRNRIDELDQSEQVDVIIKSAINHAYIYELAKYDKRISTTYIPVINGAATLPDDLDTIEQITPSLTNRERRVGNSILSSRDVTFNLVYSYIREPLINDTDVLDMSDKFKLVLSNYACYVYFEYRKKSDIANMYFNQYNDNLNKLIDNDDTLGDETVVDFYSSEVEE